MVQVGVEMGFKERVWGEITGIGKYLGVDVET